LNYTGFVDIILLIVNNLWYVKERLNSRRGFKNLRLVFFDYEFLVFF